MSDPKIVNATVLLACECGAEHYFPRLLNDWEHIWGCTGCGRNLSARLDARYVERQEANQP